MVEVIVNRDSESFIIDTICPDQSVEIASIIYDEPGQFQTVIPNLNGCDSTVNIEIIESPFAQQVSIIDSIEIQLGELIDLLPTLSADVDRVEWFLNGVLISEDFQLTQLLPFDDGTYELMAFTEFGCLTTRSIIVEVDRDFNIYIPNIFSRQGVTDDNKFLIGTDIAVQNINDMRIYDRWGELIFNYEGPIFCLLYTSPSPRDKRQSRMPSSA